MNKPNNYERLGIIVPTPEQQQTTEDEQEEKTNEIPIPLPKRKEKKDMVKVTDEIFTKKFLIWDVVVNAKWLRKREPLLFYITEENQLFLYYKTKPGLIQPKDQYGKKKENIVNEIHPRKMLNLNYGSDGEKIRCYVHYEKERYSYPHEPVEDAKRTTTVMKNIQSNYKNYDEATNPLSGWQMNDVKKLLLIIGGIIGILIAAVYLGNIFGVWELLGWVAQEGTSQATTTVTQNITEKTSSIVAKGVITG